MDSYEGLFIISPALGREELDKTLTFIKDQILKHKGNVDKAEDLGRKKMAYLVKKQREGQYYLLSFKAEPKTLKDLEHAYRLNDNILKTLITKKGKATNV